MTLMSKEAMKTNTDNSVFVFVITKLWRRPGIHGRILFMDVFILANDEVLRYGKKTRKYIDFTIR